MNLDFVDREIFRELDELHEELTHTLIALLKKEKEIQTRRGKKKYREEVIGWMKKNLDNSGEPLKKKGDEYYTVEFEYTKANKKRKRVYHPKEEVELPDKVLKMAFLSGKDSRMVEKLNNNSNSMFGNIVYDSNTQGGIQISFGP